MRVLTRQRLYGFYNGNQAHSGRPVRSWVPVGPSQQYDSAPQLRSVVYDTIVYVSFEYASPTTSSLQVHWRNVQSTACSLRLRTPIAMRRTTRPALISARSPRGLSRSALPELEYGNSDFDVRHHIVVSYDYELPFGRGKAFAGKASGVSQSAIGTGS